MATYRLKRFTGESQGSGGNTAAKVGLGVLGTAGVAAGGFAMARRGMFGTKMAFKSNKLLAQMGNKFNKQSWVDNAAEKYGKVIGDKSYHNVVSLRSKQGIKLGELDDKGYVKDIRLKANTAAQNATAAFKKKAANNFGKGTAATTTQ